MIAGFLAAGRSLSQSYYLLSAGVCGGRRDLLASRAHPRPGIVRATKMAAPTFTVRVRVAGDFTSAFLVEDLPVGACTGLVAARIQSSVFGKAIRSGVLGPLSAGKIG